MMFQMDQQFQLHSEFAPAGDQPKAIEALVSGVRDHRRTQVLLGVTGSGKTFTMANVIQRVQRPTLVLSHNKTLAAQLYSEFREFFPHNAVTYFVSYYDYYQPEAYIPQRDIYIEKDASINQEIDRLRLLATSALVSRNDVIVVATVSCIYGLGSPKDYLAMMVPLHVGQQVDRDNLLLRLVDIQYDRNDFDPARGKFRVRGDVIEIWPAYEEFAYRVELWGDEIEKLSMIDPVSGRESQSLREIYIYPAKHFVLPQSRIDAALDEIREELDASLKAFQQEGKLLEAQRLAARTRHDLELMKETGFCPGIENYSRALAGRRPGEAPYTLYDFFPEDFLLFVDESHVTIPQIRAMYAGDHARKTTLVDLLLGLHTPDAGDVLIDGVPLALAHDMVAVDIRPHVKAPMRLNGTLELRAPTGELVRLFGDEAARLRLQFMTYAGRCDWLLGGTPSEAPNPYSQVSVLRHVRPDCPPTLLMHGAHDEMAPISAVRDLQRRLEQAGVPVTAVYLPHTDHMFDLVGTKWSPAARIAFHVLGEFLAVIGTDTFRPPHRKRNE